MWIRRQICDTKSCGLRRWMYKKSKGCETGKNETIRHRFGSLSQVFTFLSPWCWWRVNCYQCPRFFKLLGSECHWHTFEQFWKTRRISSTWLVRKIVGGTLTEWPKCDITVAQLCFDLYKMRHIVCHMINVFKLVNQGTSDRSLLSIHFWFSPRFTRKPHFIDLLMAFWRVMSNFA